MTYASRAGSSSASWIPVWYKKGKLSMQLGWFGLPERSWASLWICNHTSVSTETAQIPFHTLATPAQPLLSLSCRSTWGIWRIWCFSPNCVFMLLSSFLFTDFFLHIVSAQPGTPGCKQTTEGMENHHVSLQQLKHNKEQSLGGQARHSHSACSVEEGMLSRKKN